MKCCLCDEEFEEEGNNPFPLSTNENDLCCDTCNLTKVLPIRIMQVTQKSLKSGGRWSSNIQAI